MTKRQDYWTTFEQKLSQHPSAGVEFRALDDESFPVFSVSRFLFAPVSKITACKCSCPWMCHQGHTLIQK